MDISSLNDLSNEALFSKIQALKRTECQVLAEIIRHLAELDARGSYRDAGFSSLFTYLTEGLGYSEGAAARRVRAVKCYRHSPEKVYELVSSGKVSLSSLAEVTPVMTEENRDTVLCEVQGSSKREAQRIAASYSAPVSPKKPCIRAKRVVREVSSSLGLFDAPTPAPSAPVIEERFGFSFEVTPEVKALYDEARAFMGHHDAGAVFEKLLRSYLDKKKGVHTKRATPRKTGAAAPTPSSPTVRRAVPVAVKREVSARDGCRCTYTSPDGRRCSERVGLQFDHRVPVAVGGGNNLENLRLLCPGHNQLAAERWFGRDFMQVKRSAGEGHRMDADF